MVTPGDTGVRSPVEVTLYLDNREAGTLTLDSTLKDDFTACESMTVTLPAGSHDIRFVLPENTEFIETLAIDFLDVTLQSGTQDGAVYAAVDESQSDDTQTTFLVLANEDGYHDIRFTAESAPNSLTVNGTTLSDFNMDTGEAPVYSGRLYHSQHTECDGCASNGGKPRNNGRRDRFCGGISWNLGRRRARDPRS